MQHGTKLALREMSVDAFIVIAIAIPMFLLQTYLWREWALVALLCALPVLFGGFGPWPWRIRLFRQLGAGAILGVFTAFCANVVARVI